jgi:Putative rRNA methylase
LCHKNEDDVVIIIVYIIRLPVTVKQTNVSVVDGWIFVDMERVLAVLTLSIALIGFQKEVVSFQQMESSRICLHRCQFPPNGTRRMLLFVSSGSNRKNEPAVSSTRSLLDGVLDRVDRTLSYKTIVSTPSIRKNGQLDGTLDEIIASVREISSACSDERPDVSSDRIDCLVKGTVSRSLQTLSSTNSVMSDLDFQDSIGSHVDYSNNPTITTTALAHSLWSYVLRPGMDSAIDATAGNGGDSVTIAKMLFPQYVDLTKNLDTSEESIDTKSQLIAIDIQESACRNTTERLAALLPSSLLRNNVRILHSSHATLPVPNDSSSIALIVYNLGFLPGSKTKDSVTTSTTTTITSLSNAARILRNGGMLSVATYPRTNKEEDIAVRAFMEGLALFSSATQSWSEYIQNVAFDGSSATPQILLDQLEAALREVYEDDRKKKWRVTEHKKLGRLDAPILLTAVRIM